MSAAPAASASHLDYANRELTETAAAFATIFQRWISSLTSEGFSYPRLRILEELHCKGPTKLKDLADMLDMSSRNLTGLADGLEHEGLARRVPHPSDRRATLLELTTAGRVAADEALAPRLEQIGRLFDRLSPTQKHNLQRALDELVAAMNDGGGA